MRVCTCMCMCMFYAYVCWRSSLITNSIKLRGAIDLHADQIRSLYFVYSVLTSVLHVLLSALRLHCSLRVRRSRASVRRPLHHCAPLQSTLLLLVGTLIVNRDRSRCIVCDLRSHSRVPLLSHFHQSFSRLSASFSFLPLPFTRPPRSDNEYVFILRFLGPPVTSH